MRANPGGQLAPAEVVGRDALIANLWRVLERQSVVLTAERRHGKTQVIKKMLAEPPPGKLPVYHDLEGVRTPMEFVEIVLEDVERFLSRWERTAEGVRVLLGKLGGAQAGPLKLPPAVAPHWKRLLGEIMADLVRHQEGRQVVFLWDELPLMMDNISQSAGERTAMELLDTLRALRQSHPGLRMVYTGSIGLHHVLAALRTAGYINPSTNDMKTVEVEPLAPPDARQLAAALLQGEELAVAQPGAAATAIADEASNVPYYIHHIVDDLATQGMPVEPTVIHELVERRLRDPQDAWELRHYLERVPRYYQKELAPLANRVLDLLAHAEEPMGFSRLSQLLEGQGATPGVETIRELLRLLQRDHYVVQDAQNGYRFRLPLIQRAWRTQRPL